MTEKEKRLFDILFRYRLVLAETALQVADVIRTETFGWEDNFNWDTARRTLREFLISVGVRSDDPVYPWEQDDFAQLKIMTTRVNELTSKAMAAHGIKP